MAKTLAVIEAEVASMWRNKAFASLSTIDQTTLLLRINMAKDMIVSFPKENFGTGWPFLIKTGYLTLTAAHTTGNIDVVQYDATFAEGTTPAVFTSAMAGRLLIPSGSATPYRIASFTSATEIEGETPYVDSSDTDVSYTIVRDLYDLATDFNGMLRNTVIIDGQGLPLEFLTEQEWSDQFTGDVGIGTPYYYGLPGRNATTGSEQIAFRGQYPNVADGVTYKYYRTVADLTSADTASTYIISYPQGGDNAIIFGALWLAMRAEKQAWSAQDIQAAKQEYIGAVNAMWMNNNVPTEDWEDSFEFDW